MTNSLSEYPSSQTFFNVFTQRFCSHQPQTLDTEMTATHSTHDASSQFTLQHQPFSQGAIPACAGIGLRGTHMQELLVTKPDVGWLEVHSENYFGEGGAPIHYLHQARQLYPVSLHGVGLSLGSSDPLNKGHLSRLSKLIAQVEPGLISEHLSWGSVAGVHFNDLLPLPYTEEALDHFCQRVTQVQEELKQQILIENPASYLRFRHSTIPEAEFLNSIAERTGAGLLLDINNVYVSAFNLGFDTREYLQTLVAEKVAEIHLAGHTLKQFDEGELIIDDHASPVSDSVWSLYTYTLELMGARPTLIEWDAALPPLSELVEQADIARGHLEFINS